MKQVSCKMGNALFNKTLIGAMAIAMLGLTQLLPELAFAANVSLTTSPDLLDAEDAFKATARMKDAKTIELNYTIADGYYMYRKRFKFAAENESVVLKAAMTPAGKVKQDATFGRVETYRKSVRILLPVAKLGKAFDNKGSLILINVISQGCADVGVCYPPLQHKFVLHSGSRDQVASNPFISPSPTSSPPASTTLDAVAKPAASISDLIRKAP